MLRKWSHNLCDVLFSLERIDNKNWVMGRHKQKEIDSSCGKDKNKKFKKTGTSYNRSILIMLIKGQML